MRFLTPIFRSRGAIMLPLPWLLPLAPAAAHALHAEHAGQDAWSAALRWTFEPWAVVGMLLAVGLYAIGLARLLPRTGQGRGRLWRQAGWFFAGCAVLAVALMSPVDSLGGALFSAHMVQHELLMIVAAPLLVLGRPFGVWMWGLPAAWRPAVGGIGRPALIAVPWRILTAPLGAWLLHAAALWLWHLPRLFDAALANDGVHVLQHLSFLVTALFFWWSVLDETTRRDRPAGALLSVFTTMMHTGALGALLTFSSHCWYVAYLATAPRLGIDPLTDQQLGGLIMWVPGGLAYIVAGLVLCARWLSREPRQAGSSA